MESRTVDLNEVLYDPSVPESQTSSVQSVSLLSPGVSPSASFSSLADRGNSDKGVARNRQSSSLPQGFVQAHASLQEPIPSLADQSLELEKPHYSIIKPLIACGVSGLGLFAAKSAATNSTAAVSHGIGAFVTKQAGWATLAKACAYIPVWGWGLLLFASALWLVHNITERTRQNSHSSKPIEAGSPVIAPYRPRV